MSVISRTCSCFTGSSVKSADPISLARDSMRSLIFRWIYRRHTNLIKNIPVTIEIVEYRKGVNIIIT